MLRRFTRDFWLDDGRHVGKLRAVPGVFSQGKSLEELKLNIGDVYRLMMEESPSIPVADYTSLEVSVEGKEAPDPAKATNAEFGFRPFPKRGGIVTNAMIAHVLAVPIQENRWHRHGKRHGTR